jgi:hypothetical protein
MENAKPAVKRISAKENKRLLASLHLPHRPDVMAQYGVYAYDLPDGQVLVDWESHGHLFPSLPHLQAAYQTLKQPAEEKHLLEGICTFTPDFPAQAPTVAMDLLHQLNLPGRGTTLSVLQEVDQALALRPRPFSITEEDLFRGLVALVGEVLRDTFPTAIWQLRTAHGYDLLEPIIQRPPFRTLDPVLLVYKELYELDSRDSICLHDHVEVEIVTAGLPA